MSTRPYSWEASSAEYWDICVTKLSIVMTVPVSGVVEAILGGRRVVLEVCGVGGLERFVSRADCM